MSKRVAKSMKGEEVDFDLLETKQKMEENKPRTLEVKQREDFVHTKRRSRGRRAVMDRLKENKRTPEKSETLKQTASASTKSASESSNTSSKSAKKASSKRKIVKKDKDQDSE